MTKKGKGVIVVILGGILTIVIYLSFKLRNDETDEIISNHYEAVGVISDVGLKTIVINYTVNDNIYQYTQNKPYSGLVEGEEFYTMVSKKDLNRARVFFARPILDTTKYQYILADPVNVHKLMIDGSELSFTYKIETKGYSRIQKYEDGKRPENLKKMKVKCRVDRPEIGYLVEPAE
jgi:hypothetical protein